MTWHHAPDITRPHLTSSRGIACPELVERAASPITSPLSYHHLGLPPLQLLQILLTKTPRLQHNPLPSPNGGRPGGRPPDNPPSSEQLAKQTTTPSPQQASAN
ncbi:MAG TPA: hypothetical protein VLL52_10440 [Anaerolineae bacterium]|nr:hypothetical protein [Anaerolineae bacterium]